MKSILPFIATLVLLSACKKPNVNKIESRSFKMGFSSWSYGPTAEDRENNYDLIFQNGDIYSEQIDDKIPWNAWINGADLPNDFKDEIAYRVSKLNPEKELLLTISPLNTDRSELIDDWDGSAHPDYTKINDTIIENALFDHISYLINQFNPTYVLVGMESNDLYTHTPEKWEDYKDLMGNLRTRVKTAFPSVKISESITLHNWFEVDVSDQATFQAEIRDYVNQMDFAAISYYPFFKGQHNAKQFQKAFDFLHENVSIPIAFVETTHLANDLSIPSYNIDIKSDAKEQDEYLRSLLLNADEKDYLFVIWWSFRDYDALWETFPEDVKDIGKIWRDTGLEDENGSPRPAFESWKEVYLK